MNKQKLIFISACLLTALSIVLGAFAAHGLKDKLSPYHLEVFQKGVTYHMFHALALLVIAFNYEKLVPRRANVGVLLLKLGILFFSGSLYVLGTMQLVKGDELLKILGPVTPVGGLCFIAGWVCLAFAFRKNNG